MTSDGSEPRSLIVRFISEDLAPAELTTEPGQHLPDFLDSQDLLELAGFLEREFDIEIEDGEIVLENFRTISSIVQFVERKRGEAANQ